MTENQAYNKIKYSFAAIIFDELINKNEITKILWYIYCIYLYEKKKADIVDTDLFLL